MAGEAGAEPVDRALDIACQSCGGQGVEVVLIGEQEHRGNAGSISDPSQASTRRSRSVGRMKRNSGATTVGPDTTRMAPVISAAPVDIPTSSAANAAPNAQVIATPQLISRITKRRVCPRSLPSSSPSPASYRMTATASDTSGWNAAPSSRSGLTSLVSAPAMKPAGNKMISAGIRSLLASTWEPTASTKIRPTPNKI